MLKIGITGGIGAGKSTVCRVFYTLGIPIYDADSRAKRITTTHPQLRQEIIQEFGTESYLPTGELNREFLAKTVFNNPDKLQILNQLIHPRVRQDSQEWIAQKIGKYPYILKEAALLFESGSYQDLDKIITVSAPLGLRIQRVLGRDKHRQKTDIEAIINKQMAQGEKEKRADFVIRNDGKSMIIPQVLELHHILLNV